MANYANRGQTFEAYIEYCNNIYRQHGEGLIAKQHTHFLPIRGRDGRIISCKVDQKAICDYLGVFNGLPVAIEAKETKQGSIRYDAVKPQQAAFLEDFAAMGGFSFVLVGFDFSRFFCIPWAYWETWQRKANGRCEAETFLDWTLPTKKSVKPAELLPEWEVKGGMYGALDYLACLREAVGD